MSLKQFAETLPDYAKDIRLNLGSILSDQLMPEERKLSLLLACAHGSAYKPLVDAAEAAAGPDVRLVHWDVTFVRRGKAGPFRSEAAVVGDADTAGGAISVRAELHDEGVGDRTIALATAIFDRR